VPDAEAFWRASDKNTIRELAASLGVPTPRTTLFNTAEGGVTPDVEMPCVVKPARPIVRTARGWAKTAVVLVHSREELVATLDAHPEWYSPALIQEVIFGEGLGVFALCEHGAPRIRFAHRRLREKPPWGGVSVLRESAALEQEAAEYASRLLSALGWHGVAMVEFKRDLVTRVPYLMEVNARFWGSLQLAVDAGVNFPLEAVRLWLGKPVGSQPEYRVGVRSRWLLGDLDHLLLRLTANGSVPMPSTPLRELLMDFVMFLRRDTKYEVESWRDPGPSLEELRAYLRDLLRSSSHPLH
jgi:predicted ATP-grasp superfamily ATP-dependent carboligase